MRGKNGYRSSIWAPATSAANRYATAVKAHTVTINNVTNVTNVTSFTNVSAYGSHVNRKHRRDHKDKGYGRPPKLMRFYASSGLLDQDVVSKMGEGEVLDETVKAVGYGVKRMSADLAHNVGDVGRNLAGAAGSAIGFVGCIAGLIGYLVSGGDK